MTNMYYIQQNDGDGWYLPLGQKAMYKSEANEYIREFNLSCLADERELGIFQHPDIRKISVEEYHKSIC